MNGDIPCHGKAAACHAGISWFVFNMNEQQSDEPL